MEDGSVDGQEGREPAGRVARAGGSDQVALVGVRRDVFAEAEHAFGNLFHRLHYVAKKLQGRGVDGAAALVGSVVELEDLLRLVLDYASPLATEVQRVSAAAVVGSIASTLERSLEGRAPDWADAHVLADPGHLSQAFGHMLRVLGGGSSALVVGREEEDGATWLGVSGFEPGRAAVASGRSIVPWALAQKLVEAQGGILAEKGTEGGVRWTLRLPLVDGR